MTYPSTPKNSTKRKEKSNFGSNLLICFELSVKCMSQNSNCARDIIIPLWIYFYYSALLALIITTTSTIILPIIPIDFAL